MKLSLPEEQLLKEILNHRNENGLCDLQYWNSIISEYGDRSDVVRGLLGVLDKKQFIRVKWASDEIYIMTVLVNGLLYFEENKQEAAMENPILIITANENETNALLGCPKFTYEKRQGDAPDDYNFYNVGKFGEYPVAHFEIAAQGSVNALSSPSIAKAIDFFNPVGVIMLGIAFGKDSEDDENATQKIGDVLISSQIADYESGKYKNGNFMSDGPISECGPRLVSTMKNYAAEWKRKNTEGTFNIETGLILSGDKVIDDKKFKATLFKRYPRAIGGEMEGRGVHEICRSKGLNEWIIVKGICDWADGNKSEDKEKRQVKAAKNVVDFLSFVFGDPESLKKLFADVENPEIVSTKGSTINIAGNGNNIQIQQYTNNSTQKMN